MMWMEALDDVPMMAFAMAPKIATPTALPIDRENSCAPVTTPRSFQSTLDCAATSDGTAMSPIPIPMMKHATETMATDGAWAVPARATDPMRANPNPSSTVLRNPMRR